VGADFARFAIGGGLGECLFREVLTDEQVKAGDDDWGKSPSIIPE
jgi:hypothetical protein